MRELMTLLSLLHDKGIDFCIQSQSKHNFYNLSLKDPRGVSHSISDSDPVRILSIVRQMYGHLEQPSVPSGFPRFTK